MCEQSVRRIAGAVVALGVLVAGEPAAATDLGPDLQVSQLAPGVWLHTSWAHSPGYGRVPANGLVVVSAGEAALVDTPWNDALTARLLDWIAGTLQARPILVIPTHAHDDNLGGLGEAHRRGLRSLASDATRERARTTGMPVPQEGFAGATTVSVGGRELELRFSGAGHTPDNIVVWVRDARVLFGGCLVKSTDATGLGNVREADLAAWPTTIRKLMNLYRGAAVVVPGHGTPGGPDLLAHTLDLLAGAARPAGPPGASPR